MTATVGQIITILTQQSDNIAFLLQEHVVIKNGIAEIKADVAGLKTNVAEIKSGMNLMRTEFGNKLDLILSKLN